MALPEFEIVRCDTYGIKFDPRKADPDGPHTKDSWVTCYELEFYIDDWEGGTAIDGTLYPAKKDYFTCAKPGQLRRMVLPYRCYYLNLSTRDERLKAALDALPTFAHNPKTPQIIELIKRVFRVDQSSPLNAQFERRGLYCLILSLLLREYPEAVCATPVGNVRRHQQALTAADNYLRTHISEDVDLEKLAESSHLHPTYFHKLFTAAYGRTPTQQLMWHRIRRSWGYLRDDNRPMAEVARLCGFSSQSYFCHKFKEITRQTPTQYRQSLRNRRNKDS